jgi:hypothetical protein
MIAILLSGHTRTVEKTAQSFNNSFRNLDKKIFCHFWNTIGHTTPVWWNINGDGIKDKINPVCISNLYHPDKILVEEEKKFKTENILFNQVRGYEAVHSQWESIYQSYKLMEEYERENDIRFDIILKTRYDLYYETIIDVSELNTSKANYIYFLATPHSKTCKIYSDILYFCNRNIFSQIMEFRSVMDNYFDIAIQKHGYIEGEQPFTKYIKEKNNFNCNIMYSNLKTWIYRLNGEKIILY